MSQARFAFSAHPEALEDLRTIPKEIRDLALLELQHLVHGHERGARLTGSLAGFHKVYVDARAEWRLVIQYRDAPAASQHRREIHLLAAGERQDHAVYHTAKHRLAQERQLTGSQPTLNSRAQAARSRSRHLHSVPPHSSPNTTPTYQTTAAQAPRRAHA